MPSQGPFGLGGDAIGGGGGGNSGFEIKRGGGKVTVDKLGGISILPVGGKLTPFNYGFLVETSGFALTDGVTVDAPLDPADVAHVSVYWAEGFVFDGGVGFDGMVAPISGRYLLTAWLRLVQDPTDDFYLSLFANSAGSLTWNGLGPSDAFIPHGADGLRFSATATALVEVEAGAALGLRIYCKGGSPTVDDGTFSMQYVSGAVSF